MDKNSLIIKTQLVAPRLKTNLLRRDRLLKILQCSLDKKLVLITAGAGYGKTTLLTQFVNELKNPFVFYTISKTDSNLNTFITYLTIGINQIYKEFGKRTEDLIEAMRERKIEIEMLIGTFINELVDTVKEELFIILEDYHLIIEKLKEINDGINYLIEHIPPNVHIIISSREVVSLALARIKSKQEVSQITDKDLKFTQEETKALFKQIYKIDVPDPIIEEVGRSSQGWITALQFIFHIVEGGSKDIPELIKRSKDNIEYFENEVFLQQREDIRSFLLYSAVLEEMTPESCDTILKRDDSSEILEQLVRKNLFISCKDEGGHHHWKRNIFSYHPLFKEFLMNKLEREEKKETIRELYLKAGEYFKSTGDYANSIQHYFLAGTPKSALEIIEREGENLIETRRFEVLEEWLKRGPESMVQKNPTLLWYQGELFSWQGKWDEAMNLYKKAKTKFLKLGRKEESVKPMWRMAAIIYYRGAYTKAIKLGKKVLEIIGARENLFKTKVLSDIAGSYYYLGNSRRAFSLLSEAMRICKKINNPQQESRLMVNLPVIYIGFGEHNRAIELLHQIIKKKPSIPEYHYIRIYLNLGHLYRLKGEFEHARNAFKKAIQVSKAFRDKRAINSILVEFGRLNLLMGNYKRARSYCERALILNINMGERIVNEDALYVISQSYLFEGDVVKAEEYINRITPQSEVGKPSVRDEWSVAKGQIKLALGELDEAAELLNSALTHKLQNKFDLMLIHVTLAKIYYKKGTIYYAHSYKHLKRALELSKTYGYHFGIIKIGRIDSSLLQFAINESIEPRYAEFLIKQIPSQYDLMISFFGGLKIRSHDGRIQDAKWKTQKSKLLFCYLLVNRKNWFSRDQLFELLWPGKSISKGQSDLRNALFLIRNTINTFTKEKIPLIEYKSGCYGVNPNYKVWLDSEEFEQMIREAHQLEVKGDELTSIKKYESAISFYQGDFLVEMYEDWNEEMRLFYKERYLRALDKVAAFYLKEQEFYKAIEYSQKAIAADEFRESAYLIAIRSYIAMRDHKSALDLYKQLSETLKNELGIEPSPQTKKSVNTIIEKRNT